MEPTSPEAQSGVVIKRTSVGLILLYLPGIVFVIIVIILRQLLGPSYLDNFSANSRSLIDFGLVLVSAFGLAMLLIATYLYRQNRLAITPQEITQFSRLSFFDRKVSHLQMTDVEDVNVAQKGILPNLFNYGTLTIETAGAVDNFVFIFCPDPNHYAQIIQQARGRYIDKNQSDTT